MLFLFWIHFSYFRRATGGIGDNAMSHEWWVMSDEENINSNVTFSIWCTHFWFLIAQTVKQLLAQFSSLKRNEVMRTWHESSSSMFCKDSQLEMMHTTFWASRYSLCILWMDSTQTAHSTHWFNSSTNLIKRR